MEVAIFKNIFSMASNQLNIVIAERKDIPLILKFIKELAEYEKLLDEVSATEEILEINLFGEHKVAEVVIGYIENKPIGFALYFYNFSTFLAKPGIYLEDLYIKPKFRGKGHGKAFLKYLAGIAKEKNCGRLEWWVLDCNKPSINFYKKLGAEAMNDWTVFRLSGEALKKLAE